MSDEIDTFGHPKKTAFLAAYAECGIVSTACRIAEVGRSTHYVWLSEDAEYKAAFAEAHEAAIEAMEQEARRRATEGWEEPVFYKGDICGSIRKFSDTLLIFMLKGAKPNTYRDRVEHTGANGGPLQLDNTVRLIGQEEARKAMLEDPDYLAMRERRLLSQGGTNGQSNGHANGNGHA